MRRIYLPELLSIHLKNYTLYPNGLNYSFDFIKGVNLVLGGNGMGKTTFVNLIKYAIIGNYKDRYDFRRTYQEKVIERRQEYSPSYFSNRLDATVITDGESPYVELTFKINDTEFCIRRDLREIRVLSLKVNGVSIEGEQITQSKYEKLPESEKPAYLLYKYEKEVEARANIAFDDLIVFVNGVLFFGEDHKTIIWNNSSPGSYDVQDELFNKYFNDPQLDVERQVALRQAKYFDSLSRHRSEDMRAIRKVLDNIAKSKEQADSSNPPLRIIDLKEKISDATEQQKELRQEQKELATRIETLENEINLVSSRVVETERKKARLESLRDSQIWETVHPSYYKFERNIRLNHICPLCNKPNEELADRVANNPDNCFLCESPLEKHAADDLTKQYKEVQSILNSAYNLINEKKREIRRLEQDVEEYDAKLEAKGAVIRNLNSDLRELQYANSQEIPNGGEIQPFLDEMDCLQKAKDEYQKRSQEETNKAAEISRKMVAEVAENVLRFSSIFSSYAEQFLGVECKLTYAKLDGDENQRFYPVIGGITRRNEEELSESQRFFVDHSFRMAILTFFYQTPTFYIVETPDSSLDISYEHNAAEVFLRFLEKPNSIIITSNLNNSTFLRYLIEHSEGHVDVVGLLDIAKQSMTQNSSEKLKGLYSEIKKLSRNEQ